MNNTWRRDYIEIYTCPLCNKGTIDFKNTKHTIEAPNAESLEMAHYNRPWSDNLFVAIAKCSRCHEPYSITCEKAINENIDYFDSTEVYTQEKREAFYCNYKIVLINPSPNIITIPSSCPTNISKEIIKSFQLYWIDEASCVNRIRIILEILLDELKIKKTFIDKKGKRKPYTLHSRIKLLSNKYSNISHILEAVKWIGNSGSHETKVKEGSALHAYSLLQYCLLEIYEPPLKAILKFSKQIIKQKGFK